MSWHSWLSCVSFPSLTDLSEDDNEHAPLACASQLQQWHKKGGGSNVAPQGHSHVWGTSCMLQEWKLFMTRMQKRPLKVHSRTLIPKQVKMAGVQTGSTDCRDTKFGPCQIGSYLCHQVAVTESNFKANASIDYVPKLKARNNQDLNYPRFPLRNIEYTVLPVSWITEIPRSLLR